MHQVLVLAQEVAFGRVVIVGADNRVEFAIHLKCILDPAHRVRLRNNVRVQKEHYVPTGGARSQVPCPRRAGPASRFQNTDAVAIGNSLGLVSRPVIDDDNLQRCDRGTLQTLQASRQFRLAVKYGYNYAYSCAVQSWLRRYQSIVSRNPDFKL